MDAIPDVGDTNLRRTVRLVPIVIECVDTDDKVEAVLPALDNMIGDGLVTMERVEVWVYRANRK